MKTLHSLRCQNAENIFEHINESILTTFNKHNFITYYKKDLHNLK